MSEWPALAIALYSCVTICAGHAQANPPTLEADLPEAQAPVDKQIAAVSWLVSQTRGPSVGEMSRKIERKPSGNQEETTL